ncbi:MAG: sulfite exporter TauE/SafE family protein [Balneolaceae bacterium]
MIFLLLLCLGVVAGILAGLFGVGGGILFTPILYFIFSGQEVLNPVTWTIGTSLFCTFTASFSSSVQQFRQHNHFLKQGLRVGILGAAGVYLGKMVVVSPFYTEKVFVTLFAVVLIFVSAMFYRRGNRKASGDAKVNPDKVLWDKASLTGGFGGFVAALAGVGGGGVMVPIMNLVYRIEISRAVSISSLAIVIISLSGWLQFALFTDGGTGLTPYALGSVDFGTALPLIIGALAGGYAGVRITKIVSEHILQKWFSVLVIIVAAMMIYQTF